MTPTLIDFLKWLNRTTSSELNKVIRRLELRIVKENEGFAVNASVLEEARKRVENDRLFADAEISLRIEDATKLIGRAS